MTATFLVIGHPANRRVTGFQASAEALGARVQVLSWAEVLRDPRALEGLPDDGRLVRIDAAGEDAEVQALLLRRGRGRSTGEQADEAAIDRCAFGQILAPRQLHEGLLDALDDLDRAAAEHPSWTILQPTPTIRTCFDKHRTAEVLMAHGVPVAPSIPAGSVDELLDAHRALGRALWVKLTCGSSASCLGVLRGGSQPALMTTVRTTPDGRFNSLRVQRVEGDALRPLLTWLLAEGARVELDLPKARLHGAFFDLRVLVICGEPRFLVVRCSSHPITNLHLGGRRGDAEEVWRRTGPEARAAILDTCRRVGRALPHWHLGVDVLIAPDFRTHAVLEVNAFGDLLPGLSDGGFDVYGCEVVAALPDAPEAVLHSP